MTPLLLQEEELLTQKVQICSSLCNKSEGSKKGGSKNVCR